MWQTLFRDNVAPHRHGDAEKSRLSSAGFFSENHVVVQFVGARQASLCARTNLLWAFLTKTHPKKRREAGAWVPKPSQG
jgi:hypothetical protein